MSTPARRLVVISQVYVPDPAAVGQHIADIAETMAERGWDVVVYTSARGYDDPSVCFPRREVRRGVRIVRLPFSSFGKRSIAIRLVAQLFFVVQASLRATFFPGSIDALLASTSPPFAGFFGSLVSAVRRAPMVWWVMDINPDQMVAAGKLQRKSVLVRIFDWMNRVTMRTAQSIVTLDDFMADTLLRKLDVPSKVKTLPPWSHNSPGAGIKGPANPFRLAHGLTDRFVVMYAGNHALQHPLDTLLDAARELEGDPRFAFVFVGGGAGKAAVEQRIAHGATNVVSLPYQPLEALADCLAAADVHVVSMGNDMVGIVHPCKIYGALAEGGPILAIAAERSHVGQIVADNRIGARVDHGDVDAAVRLLQAFAVRGPRAERTSDVMHSSEQKRLVNQFCDGLEASAHNKQPLLDGLKKSLQRVTTSGTYLPEVDGLRFIAVMAVLVAHAYGYWITDPSRKYSVMSSLDAAAESFARLGVYGVHLFFMISGFVLAMPFCKHALAGGKPVELMAYFWRRITRLEPPYIVSMLLFFTLMPLAGKGTFAELTPHLLASLAYVHELVYGGGSPINNNAWSLEIEIQFYLLMPLVAAVLWLGPIARRGALGLTAAFLSSNSLWLPSGSPRSILQFGQFFLLGILLCDFWTTRWKPLQRSIAADIPGLVAWPLFIWSNVFHPGLLAESLNPWTIALLFYSALRGRMHSRVLSYGFIPIIGGMCYSIYLVHARAIAIAVRGVLSRFDLSGIFIADYAVVLACSAVVTLIASAVFFVLIERPCMNPNWPADLLAWIRSRQRQRPWPQRT